MRPVDADYLLELSITQCVGECENCKSALEYGGCGLIDEAPTIEVRPKGEWKCFIGSAYYGVDEDNEPIWKERKIYHCPFCNRRTVIKENFCPNCGADMRGG